MTQQQSSTPGLSPAEPLLDNAVTFIPGRSGDMARIVGLLLAVGGDDDDVQAISIPGDPSAKPRARYTKAGVTYTPMKDRRAEARTAGYFRHLRRTQPPMTGNVAIACIFFRSNRQRIDDDNMLKHICDAATGVLWIDDSQVTAIVGIVEYDTDLPRTLVAIAHHQSTMTRGSDCVATCEGCGREYQWVSSHQRSRRFCTARCARTAMSGVDLSAEIDCSHCSAPFRRKTSEQKFCSTACAREASRGVPKPTKKNIRCTQCGTVLSHNRGGRCRDCWRANPKGTPPPVQTSLIDGAV